ncbi:MAG: MBOAT family protein [Prolixibacteraceae bacterium]
MLELLKNSLVEFFGFSSNQPWLFTQLSFWIFFTIVIGIYSFFYQKVRARNVYLLLISLFFYYKTGGWFLVLLIYSCVSNYSWGYFIGTFHRKSLKRLVLILGLLSNFGLLIYFKYAYFLTGILNHFTGDAYETYNWLAQWWNAVSTAQIDASSIILPIGISFFTFQSVSYLIDVYRGHSPVVKNIFDFSFYLSFFPQLVAGPIVRASSFIPQIYRTYKLSKREFSHALFLILAGLIKKMVISDYLALNFIDRIFDQPGSYTGAENLMAIYAYALQIYCDFSGYTDIAIGVALMLGFKLPLNFNSPYKAVSLTDFWRRWHISLSSWLRDYLYIPLGGNRKGKIRTYINLMITMLLGGLWHGANIKFVIWGGIHGLGLVFEKALGPIRKKIPVTWSTRLLSMFFTYQLVSFAWLFFRADSIEQAWLMALQIVYSLRFSDMWSFLQLYPMVAGLMFAGYTIHLLPSHWQEFVRGQFIQWPLWVKGIVVLAILYLINSFLLADIQAFIYFRF